MRRGLFSRITSVIASLALVLTAGGCALPEGFPLASSEPKESQVPVFESLATPSVATDAGNSGDGDADGDAVTGQNNTEQGPAASALSMSAQELYRRQIPGILTDHNVYTADEDKVAVFRGEKLPASYEIRADDTDQFVYSGEVRLIRESGEDDTLMTGIADFTALTAPGRYYIKAPILGESYAFSVTSENEMSELLTSELRRYYLNRCGVALTEEFAGADAHGVCHSADATLAEDTSVQLSVTGGWHMSERADRYVEEGARVVSNLLLAYELNPTACGDDTGIPESGNEVPDILDEIRIEVEWLLKMQDAQTGGVYAAALTVGNDTGNLLDAPVEVQPVASAASIAFAAALAKFSNNFRQYDDALATACLRAADRAYSWYVKAMGNEPGDEAFAAVAELYRATGRAEYRTVLARFFEQEGFADRVMTETPLFFGAVTYLMTGQSVDVEMAEQLMAALTQSAETFVDGANRSLYGAAFVPGESDAETVERLLFGMRLLAVRDHASYSFEYTQILREHVHALGGLNPEAKDYLNGFTGDAGTPDYPGIINRPEENAELAVAVAMLLSDGLE